MADIPVTEKRLMEILQQMFEPKFDAIDNRFARIEKELVEIKGFQKMKLMRLSLNYIPVNES